MDLHWLLTSTFYGNWLPGDPRGFASRVRDVRPDEPPHESRQEHDIPGTPYDADLSGLYRHAQQVSGSPIRINEEQARKLLAQFQETAAYRDWTVRAVAIMTDHVHVVLGVRGDPDPTRLLGDLKSYGSRVLNRHWAKPANGTWWTYSGSKRKLRDETAVQDAIHYVLYKQPHPLLVWAPDGD